MPTLEPYYKLLTTTIPLAPVPRIEVEEYLRRFAEVSAKLDATADPERMDWDAWRGLRHPDYFIQWNIHQGRFRFSLEEYIERWKWTIRQGRGWEKLDAKVHIIDTGFIVEGLLRSTHHGADDKSLVFRFAKPTTSVMARLSTPTNTSIRPTFVRLIAKFPAGGEAKLRKRLQAIINSRGTPMTRVAGMICLITGGAMGLGYAEAQALAKEGARVVIADIDEAAGRDEEN